ncbi:MAG: tRNA (N6-isopentenyl adenosine(37)-C2)-methylthiotransferase MiaB [Planctomycetes bacterium]|nr:tRNA (N6-isopentenyl adenosine(37)-C2)-methylthiotransferase MiaB [Planctomycetota bacterium]
MKTGHRQVHIITFGCQMNKLDSELIAQSLQEAGHNLVDSPAEADTVLYNTCSVRKQAENRVLSHIGMLAERKQSEPHFLIGVMGCMAQRMGKTLRSQYPLIDLVIGTRQFHRIGELLEQAEEGPVVAIAEEPLAATGRLPRHLHPGGPKAWVAVMRGCNNFCSYCVVPYVRGREESRPLHEVVEEIRQIVSDQETGAVEVTLLGQSIDNYGQDLTPPLNLLQLLQVVDGIKGLKRLRFITAHPRAITPELFEVMNALPTVCEHLHMPAQSGSDKILKAMRRGYTSAQYRELLAIGRERVPGIAFASDFIVGFPGETEEDFLATLELVKAAEFQNIFAFRYSPRPGTKAAEVEDNVPLAEKNRRLQALLQTQEEISEKRNQALVGSMAEILVEGISHKDPGRMTGRTRTNYIVTFPVPLASPERETLIGEEILVKITSATALTLLGERVEG